MVQVTRKMEHTWLECLYFLSTPAMWYVLGGGIYVGLLTHMLTTLLSNNKHHNGAGVEKSAYTST